MIAVVGVALLAGLRLIWMRPLFGVMLVPSMPMNEERLATSGSLRMTRVRAAGARTGR